METVTLYRPNDLHSEYLSTNGAVWVYSADDCDRDFVDCDICGSEIYAGFQCLDGGEFVCGRHIEIIPESIGEKLAAEFNERISLHNRLVAMRCTVGNGVLASFNAQHKPRHYLGWVQPRA